MKKTLVTLSILLASQVLSFAQKKAMTDTGEEVLLFDNGTWKYTAQRESWTTSLDTIKCTKPTSSSFLVKGEKVNYGIWINPKKWKFKKEGRTEESPAEYSFTLTGEDAYALIISERIEVPLNELKELAFKNAQAAAPDIKIVTEDIRNVNGKYIVCIQMDGTVQGIKVTYLAYYYSSEAGSIQMLSYTSQNLFSKYKPELESFLNGFVIIE